MKTELSFNFHSLVGLIVDTPDEWTRAYFDSEYGLAAGPIPAGVPVVVLQWRRSRIPRSPGRDFQFRAHKGFARWYYKIDLQASRMVINAAGTKIAVPMVHHMLVHGSLRYLCSQHDVLLLHSSAVAALGQSVLFTGPGGVGKTSISSLVLDQGRPEWCIHGDDYVFVNSAGDTYSYPSRAHLYADILDWVPSLRDRLSRRQRLHLKFFGAVRRLSGQRIKWPLRYKLQQLWPGREVGRQAQLNSMLVLEREELQEARVEPAEDLDYYLTQLTNMNFREARHTLELFRHALDEGEWLEGWLDRERDILQRVIREGVLKRLILPDLAPVGGQQVLDQIQDLLPNHDGIRPVN